MADTKYPPLLKNTPFVGSASNRLVHRTDSNCPRALEISPNERWYIKDIPHDGNYIMCPFCFPQPKDDEETENPVSETPAPVKTRRKPVSKAEGDSAAKPKKVAAKPRVSAPAKKKAPKN